MKNIREFTIKSVDSDLAILLTDVKEDHFTVQIVSEHMRVIREVWAYTDAYGLADLFDLIASYNMPWLDVKHWESLEGEFKFSATCSRLGHVIFEVELSHAGCQEEWMVQTQLNSEFGQLPELARSARAFFGKSPT